MNESFTSTVAMIVMPFLVKTAFTWLDIASPAAVTSSPRKSSRDFGVGDHEIAAPAVSYLARCAGVRLLFGFDDEFVAPQPSHLRAVLQQLVERAAADD